MTRSSWTPVKARLVRYISSAKGRRLSEKSIVQMIEDGKSARECVVELATDQPSRRMPEIILDLISGGRSFVSSTPRTNTTLPAPAAPKKARAVFRSSDISQARTSNLVGRIWRKLHRAR